MAFLERAVDLRTDLGVVGRRRAATRWGSEPPGKHCRSRDSHVAKAGPDVRFGCPPTKLGRSSGEELRFHGAFAPGAAS